MTDRSDAAETITEAERALLGTLVDGTVIAVFQWGVIVDLSLSHVGYIDPLYIDETEHYEEGVRVNAYLSTYDERMGKFWLRPPGQVPISERLKKAGF